MSIDFFVNWKKRKPTKRQVGMVLEDFFSEIGKVEDNKTGKRYIVTLPGKQRHPLRRIVKRELVLVPIREERWIEVYYGSLKRNIDVITRTPDEITLSLARGVAAVFARFWEAETEGLE